MKHCAFTRRLLLLISLAACCAAQTARTPVSTNSKSSLLQGSGTCTYSLSSSGQVFGPAGGVGAVTVTTQDGCSWSVSGAPAGVILTGSASGSGSGTVTFLVLPNAGTDSIGTLIIGGTTFTIEQQAVINGMTFVGSMPHVAAEGGWSTTFTFVNKGSAQAIARTSLFASDGTSLALPLSVQQQTSLLGPLPAASIDQSLAANASFTIQASGPAAVPFLEGSAQLAATGALDGFAIFHFGPNSQEAVVPMETRNASSFLLAFDNTNSVLTGVAIENVSGFATFVPVVIRDDAGAVVFTGSIPLSASGHTSFVLSAATQFPFTANMRGTIEFDTPPGGRISVLGIRYTAGTLTTIPAMANVGGTLSAAGGMMAHLASANGWETTFVLVNTGAAAAHAHLKFFDDTGAALALPLEFPQAGGGPSTVSATVDQTIAAGASLWVRTSGALGAALQTGSAQLTTDGNIGGHAIFRFTPNGQEAVVPLESRNAGSYLIAFDNTAGTATGIAVSSVSSSAAQIPVTVRDESGAVLGTASVLLAANGHTSFVLTDRFPQTAGIRGTLEFDAVAGAQISAMGIRTPRALTFTSLPPMAK